jgi:hypothetical protein
MKILCHLHRRPEERDKGVVIADIPGFPQFLDMEE